MQFVRNTGKWVLITLFGLSLLFVPVVFALQMVIGTPEPIKKTLRESGTYESAVSTVVEQTIKDNEQKDPVAKQLLADPAFKEVFNKSITPDLLQSNAERNIDAVHAWLIGKSDTVQVKLETGDLKSRLHGNLTTYVKQRADKLPPCTPAQLRAISPDMSPLAYTCLPPGTDTQAMAELFAAEMTNRIDTAEQVTPTVETPTDEKITNARNLLGTFVRYYWLILLLPVVLGGLYVLLHRDRLLGVRQIARSTLANGIFMSLALIIGAVLLKRLTDLLSTSEQSDVIGTKIVAALSPLAWDFGTVILWWALGYLALGIGTLVWLHRRQKQTAVIQTPTPAI